MKRTFLALLLTGCNDPTILIPVCDEPCAIDNGTLYVGDEAFWHSCHPGKLQCADGLQICEGFKARDSEFCQNMAGNCDSDVEDGEVISYWDERNPCIGEGVCRYTSALCLNGSYVCLPPKYYGPEVCDAEHRDENCNGLVNEEDPDLVMSENQFEYGGPPGTINVGECRAGVRTCGEDGEFLFGEIQPTQEVCGNGKDDDCDGFIDEDETGNAGVAFSLVVDFSGSMDSYIDSVIEAICDWSSNETFNQSLFQVIAVGTEEPYVEVIDFSSASEVCFAMGDFRYAILTGGSEFVPHAIYDGTREWPAGLDKRVIFFSDEDAQGIDGYAEDDIYMVTEECASQGYTVGGFISTDYATWLGMTRQCNGWLESLSMDPYEMRDSLNQRFGTEC